MLTGHDHLLFLFGAMFFLTRLRDVFTLITAFTLGHCITLLAATLLRIQANAMLVDALIALTVCYKAFENLDGFTRWLEMQAPKLAWVVFAIGLIHGLGLSTRLQQITWVDEEGLVARILSFNVGVEAGQIVALAAMWAVLATWRKTPTFARLSRLVNTALMAAGALLLLMHLHGYRHERARWSFPINTIAHDWEHRQEEQPATGATGAQPLTGTAPAEATSDK
jgi:hypothetical protein